MARSAHLGEAGLLARMLPQLPVDPRTEVGPGDDAAVVRLASSRLVISTDSVVEGYDFLRTATTAHWIGRRIAVQNLADIAAMGARPQALVVAISAPRAEDPAVFAAISAGCAQRASADGATVVGGDLGRADALTATVTAVGAIPDGQEPIRRSGALPGDVLAVGSGQLGRSAAGLALVLSGRVRIPFDGGDAPTISIDGMAGGAGLAERARALVAWHDAPDPDLSLGWTGGRSAHAMIDVSDGLVRDAGRIAGASEVVIDLDRSALAGDATALADLAGHLGADPWQWILHSAEEHAMLAAFAPDEVPAGFRPVGRVLAADRSDAAERADAGDRADASAPGGVPEGAPRVLLDGRRIGGEGFDHFG
ncbi:thiamine-phosphate kinase [Brachybacterium sp. DNPG3]